MSDISIISIDLAKSVFHLHMSDSEGRFIERKALRRRQLEPFIASQPRCLIAMEACSSSHHWARVFTGLGFDVRLLAPIDVKPFVKRQKNDWNDAAAIAVAVRQPGMNFVAVKSEASQGILSLHKVRELLVRQRTATINALRSHLSEFGDSFAKGRSKAVEQAQTILDGALEVDWPEAFLFS